MLKPHWLTENVYALVRHAEQHSGVLRREELPAVLLAETDPAMQEYLVRIMERFELAYPVDEAEEERETRQWLVPLGLPDDQPEGVESFSEEPDSAATRLRYRYTALPAGLVARFTVRVHPLIQGEARWASGVVLGLDGARALVRSLLKDEVEITVTGPAPARQQIAGLCQREFREIHAGIAGLNPVEETRVGGTWVPVTGLEKAEVRNHEQRAPDRAEVITPEGPVEVQPTRELNEFTTPAARDDSWKPRVFIAYSKHDAEKRRQLTLRLKVLATAGLVHSFFHDRMIQPGEDWDARIKRELEESDVIVFLVSAEMLATDYVAKVEMARAMERRADLQATVVPVILEPCEWEETTLKSPNALPEKDRALTSYTPRANGWKVVSEGLKGLFTELQEKHARKRR